MEALNGSNMCSPKKIEEVTLDDLKKHRWCFYHNDALGYDCFEHVIPDTHPDFSSDIIELELTVFKFSNGITSYGVYNGSASFDIYIDGRWFSFWYGVAEPSESDIVEMAEAFANHKAKLPVNVITKWSKTTKTFNGVQFVEQNGNISEIRI